MEKETGVRVMEQAWDFWIKPEIDRRRKCGRISKDFNVTAAQIIFDLDTKVPQIRLNDEVKAVADVKINRDVKKGEALTASDIDGILDIKLTEDDPNAAHITMVLIGKSWIVSWDARYNAARIFKILEVAEEFKDGAKLCLEKEYMRPFLDNLFSAIELMAKSFLLILPDKTILTGKKQHRIVSTKFNLWGKLGNTDHRFVELLNRLSNLRPSARYLQRDLNLSIQEAQEMLVIANEMFQELCDKVPKRVRINKDTV